MGIFSAVKRQKSNQEPKSGVIRAGKTVRAENAFPPHKPGISLISAGPYKKEIPLPVKSARSNCLKRMECQRTREDGFSGIAPASPQTANGILEV
jgi:hypothetical protein